MGTAMAVREGPIMKAMLFTNNEGGTGGGMTWFSANSNFTTSTVLMVAGGGGGAGGQGDDGPGGPGAGGGAGGTSGSDGGMGSAGYCWVNYGECAGGGGGATQGTAGLGGTPAGFDAYTGTAGVASYGGYGGNAFYTGGAGGGGGGGFYGGGGGAGNGYYSGGYSGGAGGGGSSYVYPDVFIGASNVAGVNSGDGYLTIIPDPPTSISSLGQYLLDGVTPLGEGSSTNQGGVVLGATVSSENATTTLQLQVEVEPAGNNFMNVPNVTSSVSVRSGEFCNNHLYRNKRRIPLAGARD